MWVVAPLTSLWSASAGRRTSPPWAPTSLRATSSAADCHSESDRSRMVVSLAALELWADATAPSFLRLLSFRLLSFVMRLEVRVKQHAGKEPAEAGRRRQAGQTAGRVRGPHGRELASEICGADLEDAPPMNRPLIIITLVNGDVEGRCLTPDVEAFAVVDELEAGEII